MLTKEENELLTQVGPGTPMGELVRRYWMPALPSSKLSEPNGDPERVRLVGEDFVVWRDQSGRVGFFDENCMHRGASLALGRCEGDGLRCIYHGWKYATDGTILETPNYKKPTVREKLRAPVYPAREAGGLIWVYLGPREKEPPFPHYKFMDVTPEELPLYHSTFDCNFVQVMEGTLDPSHVHILHQDTLGTSYTNKEKAARGDLQASQMLRSDAEFTSDDNAPLCEVEDTLFGCHGVAIHDAVTAEGVPTKFGRVHTWIMPFLSMPTAESFIISVPIDDHHTSFYTALFDVPLKWTKADRDRHLESQGGPASHYENGHYRWGAKDRWGQDRSKMRSGSFSGIAGVLPEDLAMITSMGPVYDRRMENLVPADQLVIRMRRRMLQTARELEKGIEPFMLKADETIRLGSKWGLLTDPSEWRERMVPGHLPFISDSERAGPPAEA